MKRIIAAGLILLLLLSMVTASASTAGTSTDPLVTLGYLSGDYASSLKSEAESALGGAADRAISRVGDIFRKHSGYRFAPGFLYVSLTAGGTVTLPTGSSFILQTGAAALDVQKGTVVNVTTGKEAVQGEALAPNQRYFCVENTIARIRATAATTGRVDGYYMMTGGGYAKLHQVFKDVLENSWFFDAVSFVYDNGLFNGTAADIFSPDEEMTRAMFVTVLHRLDESERASSGAQPARGSRGSAFSDVKEGEWFADAVAWATENGMIEGFDNGTFQPNIPLTREQMALIIYRYATYKGRNMSAPGAVYDTFPDRSDVSSYAAAAMRWVVSHGVINGSNGKLLPKDSATRAQVAQIFWNYCMLSG